MNTNSRSAGILSRAARFVLSAGLVTAVTAGLFAGAGIAQADSNVIVGTQPGTPTGSTAGTVHTLTTPPACTVSTKLVPSCGTLVGIATNKLSTQTWDQSVTAYEKVAGQKADVLHNYHLWDTAFPDAAETARAKAGQTLYLTWMGQTQKGANLQWSAIASGSQDAVIKAEALRIKALGVPVFLTFQHEAEARIGTSGTAAQYVAAYQHIHNIFVAQGATNAVWTVVYMGAISDTLLAKVKSIYPGDAYVDYIGWDPYNWGTCMGKAWNSFSATVKPFYDWLIANGHGNKPFMLGEYGSVEGSAGAKAAFFAGEAVSLSDGEFSNLKVVNYFDHPAPPASCDWRLASSASSNTGYAKMAQDLHRRSTTPVTAPAAPTAVAVTTGTLSANISWKAPTDTGNGYITGYRVQSTAGGLSATVSGPLPVTHTSISGLKAGTSYSFTVTAINSAGAGSTSAPSFAVAAKGPSVIVPAPAAATWKVGKLATFAGAGAVQLTNATSQYTEGTAFYNTPISATSFSVSFDSTISGGTGGDGTALVFGNAGAGVTSASAGASGSGLGFSGIPGFAVALDTYQNGTDPSNNFVGLATGGSAANAKNLIWKATSTSAPALRGATRHISVVVSGGQLSASVDGTQVLSTTVALPAKTIIGFTAGSGGHTDRHLISNVVISAS